MKEKNILSYFIGTFGIQLGNMKLIFRNKKNETEFEKGNSKREKTLFKINI